MKYPRLLPYYFFSLLFCLINSGVFSQSCDCPEYYTLKAEQEKNNTAPISYTEQLKGSGNIICRAKSYEWTAIEYLAENNSDTAAINFQQAEKLYKQSGCSDSILLTTYKYEAQLYYAKADFAKAQEYSFKLLQAAEAAKNPYEIAGSYTMIAQLFNQTGQADKGILYSRLAVPLVKQINDPVKADDILFKLSKRYLWHYQDTKTMTSLDSSALFSMEQLAIARSIHQNKSIAKAFSNLEGVAWERQDYQQALQYLDSSFKYTDQSDIGTLATNYSDKADLLIELKKLDAAEQMADSALYHYKRSGAVVYIAATHDLLSRIAREKGDYKTAYEQNELGRAITDSVRNVEKTKQVAELEKKYSQAKNEKRIGILAQQKKIYLLLAIAGLMGLMALAFFLRQQSLKNKQKILETEQRLNRARMNPHFFFNALSSLQAVALTENDGKVLARNLSKFSHIMRETLESSYTEYISIEKEIDFLNEYLDLQKIRFPQKFSWEIKTSQSIETDELMIPSMILQPFAENSIEHGFSGIDYPGHIAISFSKDATGLHIIIADNGRGLSSTDTKIAEHISRASQIIRDRLFLLNAKLKTTARFSIANNAEGKGVQVNIILPVLYIEDIKKG